MAIKKSELYSSLWASCDELRGGMDASQYKDYVLTMLFVKYVSDKYAGKKGSLVDIPDGATFDDMVALKGKPDIGDRINKEIIRPLFAAVGLEGAMEMADFNDDDKLGEGKDKIDLLTKLIAIFENKSLDFKNNRAEDDDILGDAYEYLMRNFATESGKSKGQFYTPSEVSRILAKVIEANKAKTASYSAYDPTCGSGSLLLKVAHEAPVGITLYGQEKDIATKGLAVMNAWLHGYPDATIAGKNTISTPQFTDKGELKRFDYVVANPPFSVKNWTNGIIPLEDEFNRFKPYGVPPEKNGDFAFLLHILASMKSTGKAAVILPHGVLFRGNVEAEIRKNLVQRKYIKGIIGLPANLFYGTGIPAAIIVMDKEKAHERKGIFMMDASKGFIKDGNKNRLREQDLHKIVDVFNNQMEVEKYSRFIPFSEIEQNEYNLNIPRYINTQEEEDIQDLDAHLNGGIPQRDIDALQEYWEVYPNLRKDLFTDLRPGYLKLNVEIDEIKDSIYNYTEFKTYNQELNKVFSSFAKNNIELLHSVNPETKPKDFIFQLSEDLLIKYNELKLINPYNIYQHLMDYWNETMKDDVYMLIEEAWVPGVKRILEKNKAGKLIDKGWKSDLIPKQLVIDKYLSMEAKELQSLESDLESVQANIAEIVEEHTGDDGLLSEAMNDKGNVTKTNLIAEMKKIKNDPDEKEAYELMNQLKKHFEDETGLKKVIKEKLFELDILTLNTFLELTTEEVHEIVVDDKWLFSLFEKVQSEINNISQSLTSRIKELAIRYEYKLSNLAKITGDKESEVNSHLKRMGLI